MLIVCACVLCAVVCCVPLCVPLPASLHVSLSVRTKQWRVLHPVVGTPSKRTEEGEIVGCLCVLAPLSGARARVRLCVSVLSTPPLFL